MPANISHSYTLSISQTSTALRKTTRMLKKQAPATFWLRLKEALKDAGKPHTQKKAAAFAEVSQPSVSLWNKPDGFPEMDKVVSMAKRLGVCVEWLYTGRGPKRPDAADDEYSDALKAVWHRLSAETKRDLVGLARLKAAPDEADPIDTDPDPPALPSKRTSQSPRY